MTLKWSKRVEIEVFPSEEQALLPQREPQLLCGLFQEFSFHIDHQEGRDRSYCFRLVTIIRHYSVAYLRYKPINTHIYVSGMTQSNKSLGGR